MARAFRGFSNGLHSNISSQTYTQYTIDSLLVLGQTDFRADWLQGRLFSGQTVFRADCFQGKLFSGQIFSQSRLCSGQTVFRASYFQGNPSRANMESSWSSSGQSSFWPPITSSTISTTSRSNWLRALISTSRAMASLVPRSTQQRAHSAW